MSMWSIQPKEAQMRILFMLAVLASFAAFTIPVRAEADGRGAGVLERCAPEAPYYFYTPAGREPGSLIASLFLFAGSLPLATAAAGTGQFRAFCMPILLAAHAVVISAPRATPY